MIALWLWLLVACSPALDAATAAMDAGDLPAATAALTEVSETGEPSGVVWYDLGISWYLRGDTARALVCWQHAARLRPRDAAVQHNLALARSQLPDTPPPVEVPVWSRVATPGELGVLGALAAAVGSVGLIRAGRGGRWPRWAWVAWAAGATLGVLGTAADLRLRAAPVAVVLDAPLLARTTPDAAAAERFRLPVGTEVRLVRDRGDWALVEDGRARRGWVSASGLGVAAPGRPPPVSVEKDRPAG